MKKKLMYWWVILGAVALVIVGAIVFIVINNSGSKSSRDETMSNSQSEYFASQSRDLTVSQSGSTSSSVAPLAAPEDGDVNTIDVCASDVEVPAGIDAGKVCGGTPVNAQSITTESVVLPSGNIGCDLPGVNNSATFNCAIKEKDWESWRNPEENVVPSVPGEPNLGDPCQGFRMASSGEIRDYCLHEAPGWIPIDGRPDPVKETLEYGNTYTTGNIACESEESGLTCWNTDDGHGFFLSRSSYNSW